MPKGKAGYQIDPSTRLQLLKLVRDMALMDRDTKRETNKRFKADAGNVRDKARMWAPRRSGRLARGINLRITKNDVQLVSSAPHARISEFGGRHPVFRQTTWVDHPARPHVFPAVESEAGNFYNDAVSSLDHAVFKAGFR